LEKELVFDIDVTDYAEVILMKEEGTAMTSLTWYLCGVAIRCVDAILREDFGFEHIMWVFSGRRGVHAWVCDERARKLDNSSRSAIADYISVIGGKQATLNTGSMLKANMPLKLHPTLRRLYESVLKPAFESIIVEKCKLFSKETGQLDKILQNFVPWNEVRNTIREHWDNVEEDSLQRWLDFEATINKNLINDRKQKNHPIFELIFTYLYPRLDINVSRQINHLLKSPFVVHPSTGRICVPIDPNNAMEFLPENVPTLSQILHHFNNTSSNGASSKEEEIDIPELNSYMKEFEKFVNGVVEAQTLLSSNSGEAQNNTISILDF